ncbi:histidine kinase [Streptomyces europaeiscabiei]|uniref:histidine kinase n=2 Tax=Streptomyces europaeiscabiei TaxID=146819 RepID=A0ABU4NVB2_9ACTN|nr:sensor histidine kinase [Streptomyces europaeiscabiei]MDX2760834.1 histidine kinase [Streptomyces europaeiscabiei]MDX2769304.1 histidine kinase [Streptomyces europaeiscabiei]MDX3549713.1 histidine kinase [Streptomyces europaeiscabiei]MDX3559000.1 histidine kinase [Streptomyces europaeiscabiei]MDX3672224.1 histidine kinase [Streptomyces europaeiscabiei]
MDSTMINGGTATGTTVLRRALDPGTILAAATAVAAGLSVMNLWWAVPTAVAAFLAGRRPGRTGSTALALVAILAAGVVALSVVPAWLPLASRFVTVVVAAMMLPWFAGRFWCQYRQLVRAGWELADQLQREQQLIADQARLRERARIAQDMHDVLGHDLSLIALSAGALKLAPDLEEHHQKAAGDIRARAAAAVERLGEVIGVLREETDATPMDPTNSSLTSLTSEASAAGLTVELRTGGEADDVPPVVKRAAHRVVREALTNVAKHASGATVTVHVTHTATETKVVVENGPPSSAANQRPRPRSGGRGLIGLQERMRLTGGSFDHGPRDGGYAVVARIPHTPSPPLAHSASRGYELPQEHRRARRRVGRALVAAVMVPLVTGALLSGALMGWEMMSASQSVLDPRDYARLHVGQDRSEVERLLPDRQTNYRPLTAEPTGDGTTCEYYSMTADRFDDRSGDAYQLCFRKGTLVSLDTITP